MADFKILASVHLASLALAALCAPALAQQQKQVEQVLPEVKVLDRAPESPVGPDYGYQAKRSAGATKTDTPLLETPQAVSIVTRQRIEDQGATSLQDALNYTAGVRSDAYGLDSRADSLSVRGAYPAEYRDGLRRQLTGYYTSTTRTDPHLLERIEVLRGPSSMLYGQGSTGGVVNMVTKRPLADPFREVGVQFGSFRHRELFADLTGPLTQDGTWLYRLVGVARDADSQVDSVPDDRHFLAPSLTWKPGAATTLTVQALVQQDRSGSTLQFLPWRGAVLPNPNGDIPPGRFLGEPGFDHYDSDRSEIGWLFEHRFSERWTVRQALRAAWNEVDYEALYPDVYSNPDSPFLDAAQRVLNRFGYGEKRKADGLAADQHIEARLRTGAVGHQLLFGLDYHRHDESSSSTFDLPVSMGGTVPPIDVYGPVYTGYALPAFAGNPDTRLTQTGIYLQDQMKLGHWIVAAGLRRDRSVNRSAGSEDEKDNATTRRAGLMYVFDAGIAPYASYSESFSPVAGSDLAGARFRPLRGEQVEVGLKWEPAGRTFAFNAALYELEEKNRLVPDPTNPLNQVQAGDTVNRGLELELIGSVLPWLDIAAHYNYIDSDPQVEALPEHQAAVWATSRFSFAGLSGLRAGLGVRYMGSFRDGAAPLTPDVTLLDAMLGYETGKWRLALNVQNATDKTYAATCLSRGDCFYGARRTVTATVAYRF